MNIDAKQLLTRIKPAGIFIKKYMAFGFVIIVLGIYGFLVFQINFLASKNPDETAVLERLKTVQRPKIDQETLTKIQQLQDQNVQVQTLFQQARENPFAE